MKEKIIFVQQLLKTKGYHIGNIDGILGTKTLYALDQANPAYSNWKGTRKLVAFIQSVCKQKSIEVGEIDGLWGTQTNHAYATLKYEQTHGTLPPTWRPEEIPYRNPNHWPVQADEALTHFFGQVGTGQTVIQLPFPHRLAWDKKVVLNQFSCHTKVHDSMKRVLTKVFQQYGMEEIKRLRLDLWGGCLNVRKKRGGNDYSTHSWGIAVDYDPDNNQLEWGRDKAAFARPEYDKWWECWEEEGWVSLGRTRNFDWMHIQAAKI